MTDDLKNSIYDGMFANTFATLTGGVFLTGFALYLGMNEAAINLCTNNLLLKMSPQENRASYISAFNITGGLGSAAGPILAGFVLKSLSVVDLSLFSSKVLPIQVIFIASTLFRLLSFQFYKSVHEPEEVPVEQMIRILRSVRGLNMANGFNYPLHPFIEIAGEKRERES